MIRFVKAPIGPRREGSSRFGRESNGCQGNGEIRLRERCQCLLPANERKVNGGSDNRRVIGLGLAPHTSLRSAAVHSSRLRFIADWRRAVPLLSQ